MKKENNIIKKHEEYLVLTKIYNKNKIEIDDSEEPDFILTSPTETFGVEITKYYYNESSARLKNMEAYPKRILDADSNIVLDKRDREFIRKISIYVKDKQDNKYKFLTDNIQLKYNSSYEWGELPKYTDFEEQLLNIIESKNSKSKHYKKGLSYMELFIEDKEGYAAKHLVDLQRSNEIQTKVAESNYKRVYIFSDEYLCIIGQNAGENMEKYN